MNDAQTDKRTTVLTLLTFLVILSITSAIAHFAIVELVPTSLYVGTLMMMPTVSAFLTLKLRGRKISDLPWRWGSHGANWAGYLIPVLYVAIGYGIIWMTGLGGFGNLETISAWSQQLGLPDAPAFLVIALMVVLMAIVQFAKSLGTIAGEEIGWRGFFAWELRKLVSFNATCLISGGIWAIWHYPIIIAYGGGNTVFQLICFTVMIIAMTVIMTYYTFRSRSVWPAIMFHGAHNIYIQKIFTPLTVETSSTALWTDEYGLMIPIVVSLIALVYWQRARKAGL
ncbi:CPBP family intramembrane glutamic endopeptidase [Maricaulis sp.]|jgi:CAAX protease family protein|uniref:CPBP family intramembrane glutamic endopeptidase n=1 Tax=Maricaulis sp. TaxID=1486257 RepID=UPI002626DDA5|nr:CPBP family intramembrane glutamic endopeptidase [Maricaulis sp.]MDF1767134.1 CPBP family intramembrane metalloprotease [Maricaulis sp.]